MAAITNNSGFSSFNLTILLKKLGAGTTKLPLESISTKAYIIASKNLISIFLGLPKTYSITIGAKLGQLGFCVSGVNSLDIGGRFKKLFLFIDFLDEFILFLHLLHSSSIKQIYQSKHLYSLLQLFTLSNNSL